MAYTNILQESILMNINMNWQNVQHMDKRERKLLIKSVIRLSQTTCGFIMYGAKYHLAHIIHFSEPYFNQTGTQTKVKEFEELGWYNSAGELDFIKIMAN